MRPIEIAIENARETCHRYGIVSSVVLNDNGYPVCVRGEHPESIVTFHPCREEVQG